MKSDTSGPWHADQRGIETIRATFKSLVPPFYESDQLTHAAVAMILRSGKGDLLETLFIQRCEHPNDPWSGQMAFPGGRVDPDDNTPEAAARRETFEEVGVTLATESLLGPLPIVKGGRLSAFGIVVHPFVYHVENIDVLRPNVEVANTVWVPLEHLGNPSNLREYYFPPDPLQRMFPSFEYGPYTIWGMTYRIVASFMDRFGIELPIEGPLASANDSKRQQM